MGSTGCPETSVNNFNVRCITSQKSEDLKLTNNYGGSRILVRPVVVYGSECWVLTENIKQKLLVFERKILRRIFGPTQKENGEWRLKTNEELEEAINKEYTGCNRRKGPDFGRVFLMLNCTENPQNTYIQS